MAANAEKKGQLKKLKALREGQTAIFKLVNAGKIDPATNNASFNAGATFEGESQFFDSDPEVNDIVILRNKIGTERATIDGRVTIVDKVGVVEFDAKGICKVKHTEPHKYEFLCLDNRCSTKRNRDESVPAVWYQIIEENARDREVININLALEAETIIAKGDTNTIMAIGESLAKKGILVVNLAGHITDTRLELQKFARINPKEVIRASKDTKAKTKVIILDAQNSQLIQFIEETNEWEWIDKKGKDKKIAEIKPGYEPVEELTNFIIKQEEENKAAAGDKKIKTILAEIKESQKELV